MAWRIVRQPDGLLARFSDVVDNFTDVNMTTVEALLLCIQEHDCGLWTAARKVRAGIEDWPPWTVEQSSEDGLSRWRDSLSKIESVHGVDAAQQLLGDMQAMKVK